MKTYSHEDPELLVGRSHPWTRGQSDTSHLYYDLKCEPWRIRTSLEDFIALGENTATNAFYELLEWLNGPDSTLESNDCGTRPPHENRNTKFTKKLECTARLMILYRDLPHNLYEENTSWLQSAVQHYLGSVDRDFEWGVVGTTLVPTNYVTLHMPGLNQQGRQLVLSFWAWGDVENEVFSNLARVFLNTQRSLLEVSNAVRKASNASSS